MGADIRESSRSGNQFRGEHEAGPIVAAPEPLGYDTCHPCDSNASYESRHWNVAILAWPDRPGPDAVAREAPPSLQHGNHRFTVKRQMGMQFSAIVCL